MGFEPSIYAGRPLDPFQFRSLVGSRYSTTFRPLQQLTLESPQLKITGQRVPGALATGTVLLLLAAPSESSGACEVFCCFSWFSEFSGWVSI